MSTMGVSLSEAVIAGYGSSVASNNPNVFMTLKSAASESLGDIDYKVDLEGTINGSDWIVLSELVRGQTHAAVRNLLCIAFRANMVRTSGAAITATIEVVDPIEYMKPITGPYIGEG